jgi:hypothetical protein
MNVVDSLDDRIDSDQLVLTGTSALSMATSSELLSSSMVMPDGEGRRLCTSVALRLGHMLDSCRRKM